MSDVQVGNQETSNGHESSLADAGNPPAVFFDSAGNEIPKVCSADLRIAVLSPGAFYTFALDVPVREVLGDSLPAGRYRVTAALAINGDRIPGLEAGRIELAAPSQ